MTTVQKLVGLAVLILMGMAGGFAGAWQIQEWRLGKQLSDNDALYQADLSVISNAATKQARDAQDKHLAQEQLLQTQDQTHFKELTDEQTKQARLRDRLATADVRLSVLLAAADPATGCNVPATAGAVGVVHAERRAQLDPAHAQRIVAITGDGDRGLIALAACQAYVRGVAH